MEKLLREQTVQQHLSKLQACMSFDLTIPKEIVLEDHEDTLTRRVHCNLVRVESMNNLPWIDV